MKLRLLIKKYVSDVYLDVTGIILLFIFVFYHWNGVPNQIFGVILSLLSFALWIVSRRQLGNSFSIVPEASLLITYGIYSKIKHPMYIFSFLCLLGLFIAINNFYLYLLLFPLIVLQIIRIRKENLILKAKFGELYEHYSSNTWF